MGPAPEPRSPATPPATPGRSAACAQGPRTARGHGPARPFDVTGLTSPVGALAVVRRARRLPEGERVHVRGLDATGAQALRSWAETAGHSIDVRPDGDLELVVGAEQTSRPAWWQRPVQESRQALHVLRPGDLTDAE